MTSAPPQSLMGGFATNTSSELYLFGGCNLADKCFWELMMVTVPASWKPPVDPFPMENPTPIDGVIPEGECWSWIHVSVVYYPDGVLVSAVQIKTHPRSCPSLSRMWIPNCQPRLISYQRCPDSWRTCLSTNRTLTDTC